MARRFKIGLLLLLSIYFLGAIGYKFFSPGTPFLDCLYMSVITVASVGFTEVINSTGKPGLRIYMITLIMLGVAVNLYAVSILTAFVVEGDLSNYFWKKRMSRKIESLKGHYIVCGAGETGMRIIDELVKTQRSFVVIDSDEKAVAAIRQMNDVCVIQGDAYDEQILSNAGIERASAAAVVLPTDRDNLVTTLSIRTMNPKIRIVVKEIEPGMASRFRRAGADTIVNPTTIGGLRLVSEMVRPSVVSFLDLMLRDPLHAYRVEELSIHAKSPWANRPLKDLPLHTEYKLLVAAARKSDSTDFFYNPDGSWVLEPGQTLIVLGKADDVSRAREIAQVLG
jgi:voltage-gated potassium channel